MGQYSIVGVEMIQKFGPIPQFMIFVVLSLHRVSVHGHFGSCVWQPFRFPGIFLTELNGISLLKIVK